METGEENECYDTVRLYSPPRARILSLAAGQQTFERCSNHEEFFLFFPVLLLLLLYFSPCSSLTGEQ